jgi:hypothetical protein
MKAPLFGAFFSGSISPMHAPSDALLDLDSLPVPMRMQPGLRRCERVQLHRLQPGSALHAEKQALIASGWQPLAVAGFDAAPVIETVREIAGLSPEDPCPLALALEEDLAVLDGPSATLPWLSVCTPSHWAPEDKLGLDWGAAHAPVADNQALMAAQRQLVALCTNGQCWERSVYTLASSPRYDQHPLRATRKPWPALHGPDLAQQAWLRVERQSFFPVRGRPGQAVFSIRLQIERLDLSASRPERAARLQEWLASMSEAVAQYKGLAEVRSQLLLWLAERGR